MVFLSAVHRATIYDSLIHKKYNNVDSFKFSVHVDILYHDQSFMGLRDGASLRHNWGVNMLEYRSIVYITNMVFQ